MKFRQVTERIGEYLGPVDWDYDFSQHAWGPNRGGTNPECIERGKEWLRLLEAEPERYKATTDGGSPKVGFHPVIRVGMYDGWPYGKPTPSVQLAGVFGAQWHCFTSITAIQDMQKATQ